MEQLRLMGGTGRLLCLHGGVIGLPIALMCVAGYGGSMWSPNSGGSNCLYNSVFLFLKALKTSFFNYSIS